MKKLLCVVLVIVCLVPLVACGGGTKEETASAPKEVVLEELKQGDSVYIIGQKANATLVNGNTIWVQVQKEDKSTVIYHCQLKDEYLEKAESIPILNVVNVKGMFLSLLDMKMENTAPLVTLYDCELVSGGE